MRLLRKPADDATASAAGKLARDLSAARERHQLLQDRLSTAESLHGEKKSDAATLAVNGASDAALDEAEAAARAAADRVETLRSALAEVAGEIATLEREAAAAAEAERREGVAREIAELAEQISNDGPNVEVTITNYANLMARAGTVVPEAVHLAEYLNRINIELAAASTAVLQMLRSGADHVRSGYRTDVRLT